jgi:hypothetical protein
MVEPDEARRTIRIPIRIVGGRPVLLYSGTLPDLKEGAVGELIVQQHDVLDASFVRLAEFEEDVHLLDAGTVLRVPVRPGKNMDGAIPRRLAERQMYDERSTHLVEICLVEPLVLRMRGTKPAVLRAARCSIPALARNVDTLNQAYSAIAGHFEPWRRSTTGNVFRKVYHAALVDGKKVWRRLELLRSAAESDLEARLFRPQTALELDFPGSGDD